MPCQRNVKRLKHDISVDEDKLDQANPDSLKEGKVGASPKKILKRTELR